jgi:hypothetical protein
VGPFTGTTTYIGQGAIQEGDPAGQSVVQCQCSLDLSGPGGSS